MDKLNYLFRFSAELSSTFALSEAIIRSQGKPPNPFKSGDNFKCSMMKNLFVLLMVCLSFVACEKEQLTTNKVQNDISVNDPNFRSAGPVIKFFPKLRECCREDGYPWKYGSREVLMDLDPATHGHYNGNGFGLRYLFYREIAGTYVLAYNFLSYQNDPVFCVQAGRSYKVVVIKGTCTLTSIDIDFEGCMYNSIDMTGIDCGASELKCFYVNPCWEVADPPLTNG